MSGIITDNLGRSTGLIKSAGGGAVLQKKSLLVHDDYTHSGTAPVAMTEFNLSFQPTLATSKLHFEANVSCSAESGDNVKYYFWNSTDSEFVGDVGTAAGSRLRVHWGDRPGDAAFWTTSTFTTWYEPASTSDKDYQIFGAAHEANGLIINRSDSDGDNAHIRNARGASTFTITEYAGDIVTIST